MRQNNYHYLRPVLAESDYEYDVLSAIIGNSEISIPVLGVDGGIDRNLLVSPETISGKDLKAAQRLNGSYKIKCFGGPELEGRPGTWLSDIEVPAAWAIVFVQFDNTNAVFRVVADQNATFEAHQDQENKQRTKATTK